MRANRQLLVDLLKGAAAGVAATWVMGKTTTWMYAREDDAVKQREDQARGGVTAYERAAEKTASALGLRLTSAQRSTAGTAMHWFTGAAGGALYELLRTRWPAMARGKGLGFGAGFFLAVDELLNPVLGLTPGPRVFPWQAHARGLGGHLAFGATTELILEGLDRVA
jgi:hypothetical protein